MKKSDTVEWWPSLLATFLMGGLVGSLLVTSLTFQVISAAVSTLATLLLAFAAVRVARQSAEISRQQLLHEQRQSSEQARIIGRILINEVVVAPALIARAVEALTIGRRNENGLAYRKGFAWASAVLLPGAEAVSDRIHHLPESLGADLATMVGTSQLMRSRAAEASEKFSYDPPRVGPLFAGDWSEVDNLITELKRIGKLSIEFADEFSAFVGAKPGSYRDLRCKFD